MNAARYRRYAATPSYPLLPPPEVVEAVPPTPPLPAFRGRGWWWCPRVAGVAPAASGVEGVVVPWLAEVHQGRPKEEHDNERRQSRSPARTGLAARAVEVRGEEEGR